MPSPASDRLSTCEDSGPCHGGCGYSFPSLGRQPLSSGPWPEGTSALDGVPLLRLASFWEGPGAPRLGARFRGIQASGCSGDIPAVQAGRRLQGSWARCELSISVTQALSMLSPRPDHSAPSEAQPLLLGSWSLRHVLGSSVDEQGTALRDRCDPTRGKVGGSLGQQPFLNMRLVILSADRQIPPAPQPLLGVGYTGRAPYIKVNDHQCLLCDKNHVTQGYPLNHFSVSTSTALSPSTLSCSPHPHPPSGLSSSSQTQTLLPAK